MHVYGIVGRKNTGKTHLVTRLVRAATQRGLVVSTVKHAHHAFDVDQPGKDSWRHREAGCTEVLVTSGRRWALIHELRGAPELSLAEGLARLSPCALVLVEGYKTHPLPKLEIWRPSVGKPLLHPRDPRILAVATDAPAALAAAGLPVFGLDRLDEIATFVEQNASPWPDTIDGARAPE